jgi:hypothetical protein
MGGKALNKYGITLERKTTQEFFEIASKIAVQLTYGLGITTEVPVRFKYDISLASQTVRCYNSKPDHGDLDVLIKMDQNFCDKKIDIKKYIQDTFKPRVIHTNGGVQSFDFKNFQIDFIPIDESSWEIAKIYYSYDPLGNIMGKTFHRFGLSYGWNGLFYKFRNFDGRNSADILITTDARKIFEFGGYNYDKYLHGFETLEDIFKFTIDCKYFDSEIFLMENLKSIDKKRNRKRGSYHLFLNYLKDNSINTRYNFLKNKEDYVSTIDQFFPEAKLSSEILKLKEIDTLNKIASQKFNGDIVMSWIPTLKGKELGNIIFKFKKMFNDEIEFRDFILNNDYKTIKDQFMTIYSEDNNN